MLPGDVGTTRPGPGMKPNKPFIAAGIRIEPPPSLAWATGTMRLATAAAEPPDEPPAERVGSHGLCVTPSRMVSVLPSKPNSDVVVLPITMRPAASSRSLDGARV